jgi:glutaconate CoA-transferase subunit A
VDAVVHAPFGPYPGEMAYVYGRDEQAIREWVEASKTVEGAQAYLDKYVYSVKNHEEYLKLVGEEQLTQAVAARERRA